MVAIVQSVALTNGPSALTIDVVAPSGIVNGELVIVHLDTNSGAQTWSAPDGTWTLVTSNTTVAIFKKTSTGSEPSTWTFTRTGINATNRATASRISNHNDVDTQQIITRASRASLAFTSMTAAEADSLLLYSACDFNGTGDPWSGPGGTTKHIDANDGLVASEPIGAGATGTKTWTPNATINTSGVAVIIKSGTPAPADPGKIVITYRANNTFTMPTGVPSNQVTVQCEGAGGGGGNGATLNRGGGGGGGAYASSLLTLTPGNTYSIVVGAGGGATTAGGLSSFGTGPLVRGAGGGAGGNASGLSNGAAGPGGTVANSIGDTKTAGSNGVAGGSGGAGAPPLGGAGGTTTPGVAPGGGGGGGAVLNGAGQAGALGVVIVTFEYVSDAVGANDTMQLVVDWDRQFNETVTAIDSIAKLVLKPMDDSVAATDSPAKLVIKKPTDETATVTDAVVKVMSFLRDENVAATDFMSMLLSMAKSDGVTVSDAFVKLISKTYDEILTSSDAMDKYLQKPITENLTATDFAFVVLVYIRTVNDTATASDVISKYVQLSKADSVAAVDDAVKLVMKKFPDEAVTASDTVFVQSIYSRDAADAASATDALSKKMTLGFSDNISGSAPPPTSGRRIFAILSD